jgi:hypothetical protein
MTGTSFGLRQTETARHKPATNRIPFGRWTCSRSSTGRASARRKPVAIKRHPRVPIEIENFVPARDERPESERELSLVGRSLTGFEDST